MQADGQVYGQMIAMLFGMMSIFLNGVGCGYTFQNSRNPLLERENIRTVYIKPLVNNSYKAGVENLVYNALKKTLLMGRKVQLVESELSADAVLSGTVVNAGYSPVATISSADPTINPFGLKTAAALVDPNASLDVPKVYNANLNCYFILERKKTLEKTKAVLWNSSFSRDKTFPASFQLGDLGRTSTLINESEFERALSDIASSMMFDVNESMLSMF